MACYLYTSRVYIALLCLIDLHVVDNKFVSINCRPAKCGRESLQNAGPKSAGAEVALLSFHKDRFVGPF